MKKFLKIILIVAGVLLGIILLDTLQARLFKNSPIISWKESLEGDSYVDKGIVMNTYYCVKDQDIVTVSWHFKNSKFSCPIYSDNKKEDTSEEMKIITNVIKQKYIEFGYMDEKNIDTFEVKRIYEYGYYASLPNIKYFEVAFNYSCKNSGDDCISFRNYHEEVNYTTDTHYNVWIVKDNDEIVDFRSGMSVNINSDFVFNRTYD